MKKINYFIPFFIDFVIFVLPESSALGGGGEEEDGQHEALHPVAVDIQLMLETSRRQGGKHPTPLQTSPHTLVAASCEPSFCPPGH